MAFPNFTQICQEPTSHEQPVEEKTDRKKCATLIKQIVKKAVMSTSYKQLTEEENTDSESVDGMVISLVKLPEEEEGNTDNESAISLGQVVLEELNTDEESVEGMVISSEQLVEENMDNDL